MEAGQFIETSVKIGMMGHLKIWDPESGDVFVNKKIKLILKICQGVLLIN